MIKIGDILVSDDIKSIEFVCHLEKCKGACCVEGDLGAPLEDDELEQMKLIQKEVKPYLTAEGLKASKLPMLRLVAPPLTEQYAIVDCLDREMRTIYALVAKVSDAIDRHKELRTALISAAVTGKIDVRGEISSAA